MVHPSYYENTTPSLISHTRTSWRRRCFCASQGAQSSSPAITPRRGFPSVAAPLLWRRPDLGSGCAASLRAAPTAVFVDVAAAVVSRVAPGPHRLQLPRP